MDGSGTTTDLLVGGQKAVDRADIVRQEAVAGPRGTVAVGVAVVGDVVVLAQQGQLAVDDREARPAGIARLQIGLILPHAAGHAGRM